MDDVSHYAIARALREHLASLVLYNRASGALERVGGNLLIALPGVAAWTIVVTGPRAGLHEEATDDPVAFALACAPARLMDVMRGAANGDVEAYVRDGQLAFEGDLEVLGRFASLPTGESALKLHLRTRVRDSALDRRAG